MRYEDTNAPRYWSGGVSLGKKWSMLEWIFTNMWFHVFWRYFHADWWLYIWFGYRCEVLPSWNNRAYGHRDVISVHHDDSSVLETCPGLNRRPDRGNRRNSGGTNELHVRGSNSDGIRGTVDHPWWVKSFILVISDLTEFLENFWNDTEIIARNDVVWIIARGFLKSLLGLLLITAVLKEMTLDVSYCQPRAVARQFQEWRLEETNERTCVKMPTCHGLGQT